jgi:hypothetical protein
MQKTISNEQLVEQLVRIYYDHEWWHGEKMSRDQAIRYHETLLDKDRLICLFNGDELIAYAECWRITFEQFGRLVCHVPVGICEEDIETGYLSYVNNVWVKPEYRHTNTLKKLKYLYFKENGDCDYHVGEAIRKKCQPIKVFNREDITKIV